MKVLISFLFFLTVNFVAADTGKEIDFKYLIENAVCSEAVSAALEVYADWGKILVKIQSLYSTPVIGDRLVCYRLLHELKQMDLPTDVKLPLQQLASEEDQLVYFDSSAFLEKKCIEAGFCKHSFTDYFRLNKTLRNCNGVPGFKSLVSLSAPRLLKTKTKVIKNLKVKIHPLEPFSEALRSELKNPLNKDVFASTMTLGTTTMYNIANDLKDREDLSLSLGFNLETLLAEQQLSYLSDYFKGINKLQLIPFSSGLNFGTIYHLKYYTIPASGRSALSAMNLSTPEKSRYLDLIYHFDDPQIAKELAALNYKNAAKQCNAVKDLNCALEFYSAPAKDKDFLTSALNATCTELPQFDFDQSGYFAYSDSYDLEEMVSQFIHSATKELVVFSYILTNQRIVAAIKAARDRGVRITVISAYYSPYFNKEDPDYTYYQGKRDLTINYPHLKAIIKDGNEMLFGTANFSNNALKSAHEMLAVTDNKSAIDTAYNLASTFLQIKNPDLSKAFVRSRPERHYIVLAEEADSQLIADMLLPEQSWMGAYRLAGPNLSQQIRECSLDHLQFINSKNLLTCLKNRPGVN